jgi:hypothetical protein
MNTYFVATFATPRKNIFHLILPGYPLQRVLGEQQIIFWTRKIRAAAFARRRRPCKPSGLRPGLRAKRDGQPAAAHVALRLP